MTSSNRIIALSATIVSPEQQRTPHEDPVLALRIEMPRGDEAIHGIEVGEKEVAQNISVCTLLNISSRSTRKSCAECSCRQATTLKSVDSYPSPVADTWILQSVIGSTKP
jgi:hypothetical protein